MIKMIKKLKKYIVSQLYPLDYWEKQIANKGERLVPKFTIDPEVIRHKSSYDFFKKIILLDNQDSKKQKITIVDLGCGVGHGCLTLSRIKNCQVVGVDISSEAINYAKKNYQRPNIEYIRQDLVSYVKNMPTFDYVISRGVLEHIPNGLDLAKNSRYKARLMFDVPYDEAPGPNPYHLITKIKEKDFASFPDKELFYEDLQGVIYDSVSKPSQANMILCSCKVKSLPKIAAFKIKFPIPAWQGKKIDS